MLTREQKDFKIDLRTVDIAELYRVEEELTLLVQHSPHDGELKTLLSITHSEMFARGLI